MTSRPRHAPLRTIQTRGNVNYGHVGSTGHVVVRSSRPGNTTKRKSAVELLQETKAFYVKSEMVREGKQELRSTRSPENWMTPSQPAKSPRCSQHSSELQDRLRLLLDLDAKENMDSRYCRTDHEGRVYGEGPPYRNDRGVVLSHCQHKSLPDLHMSPGHTSTETSESSFYEGGRYCGDSRSAYSSSTQPLHAARSSDFRKMGYIISDGYSGRRCEFTAADPRIYASLRVTKSGELLAPRVIDTQSYWRRNSNTSSGNRSQHNSSSKHSQSADSGRQSQVGSTGLRTGRSGLPEVMSPSPQDTPTTASDSGAEDGSPPLYRSESCEPDKRRQILRSKSDISHRYCPGRPPLTLPNTPLLSSSQLERFFDHLGMDPAHYRELATHNSRSSSPVFFSSVSSIDSCLDLTTWTVAEADRVTETPSIVERNARIIKWLCNCRKAQMTGLTLV